MRWVSPYLLVGTAREADQLGDLFSDDPNDVAAHIRELRQAMVVPTVDIAAEVLRVLGYDEDWIEAHVLSDWEE